MAAFQNSMNQVLTSLQQLQT